MSLSKIKKNEIENKIQNMNTKKQDLDFFLVFIKNCCKYNYEIFLKSRTKFLIKNKQSIFTKIIEHDKNNYELIENLTKDNKLIYDKLISKINQEITSIIDSKDNNSNINESLAGLDSYPVPPDSDEEDKIFESIEIKFKSSQNSEDSNSQNIKEKYSSYSSETVKPRVESDLNLLLNSNYYQNNRYFNEDTDNELEDEEF